MNPSDWKYEFVRRRTYDNYVDRMAKRISAILERLEILEVNEEILAEEIQGVGRRLSVIQYEDTRVALLGRADADDPQV